MGSRNFKKAKHIKKIFEALNFFLEICEKYECYECYKLVKKLLDYDEFKKNELPRLLMLLEAEISRGKLFKTTGLKDYFRIIFNLNKLAKAFIWV